MLTGQIQQGSLVLKNNIDYPIEKIVLFSSNPSLCGFARKTIENIDIRNSQVSMDFNFICDSIRSKEFTILGMYLTNDTWRHCTYK